MEILLCNQRGNRRQHHDILVGPIEAEIGGALGESRGLEIAIVLHIGIGALDAHQLDVRIHQQRLHQVRLGGGHHEHDIHLPSLQRRKGFLAAEISKSGRLLVDHVGGKELTDDHARAAALAADCDSLAPEITEPSKGFATSDKNPKRLEIETGECLKAIFRGGPARSMIHGLGEDYRWLAVLYAVCLIAAFGIGFNAFQGNTVAGAVQDSLGIERYITGGLLAVVAGFIVFGGIHRIAKATDVAVPIMAVSYILMALVIILMNIGSVPGVLATIFANAFGFEEAVGGSMGAAIAQDLRRSLFSNEAGLGSAPNVAATADVRHPITQSFSVFIDTIFICSCTAFVILLGDVYTPGAEGVDGIVLTQQSLMSHLGAWSQYLLSLIILLFAFSSIIYKYYLSENALTMITENPMAVQVLRVVVIAIVFIGATAPGATAVFFFSDPMMGILALVNLIAIMMLLPTCLRILRDFGNQLKSGVERPVFNPDDFPDLDVDRTAWTGKEPE